MIYEEIRPRLQTGDVILFSGRGIISDTIRAITRSRWSHVGLVYCVPERDLVLSWESTTLCPLSDVDAGRAVKGVQLVPLSARVATYPGQVAVRLLDWKRDPDRLAYLDQFRKQAQGRPYELHILELVLAAIAGNRTEDAQSLFCSELAAASYQALNLLPDDPLADNYRPCDFSTEQTRLARRLTAGATLGPEILLSAAQTVAALEAGPG